MSEFPHILERIDDVLMAVGGVVLLVAILRWLRAGRRDPLRGSPIRVNTLSPLKLWFCLLIYTVVGFAAQAGAGLVSIGGGEPKNHEVWRILLAANIAQVLWIAVALILVRMTFVAGLRGFGFGRCGLACASRWSVGGLIVSVGVCGAILTATQWVIEWIGYVPPKHSVFETLEDPSATGWMRMIPIVGAILLAPIGEELLFRGFLQTGVQKLVLRRGHSLRHRWIAISVAACLFGLMHLGVPHHIPALIAFGVILGYLYERTGSITVPIFVHMLFNAKTLLWYQFTVFMMDVP